MSHHRRRKRHVEEEHENHERWLVSYADMVTLLMCLFIVLFAMSQVDKDKYAALANGLSEGFGRPTSIMDGGTNASEPSIEFMPPVSPNLRQEVGGNGPKAAPAGQTEEQKEAQAAAEAAVLERMRQQVRAEAKATYAELARARDALDRSLRRAGFAGAARYQITERGLVVTIVTEPVLFASARAELRPRGREILAAIAPTLRNLPNPLIIEGHTNQLRLLPGSQWPSDWELSAYRATTVLRYLEIQGRVPEARMHAAGFGDTRPLIDPSDPASVVKNRRVDIVVMSTASAEANALLPGLDRIADIKP